MYKIKIYCYMVNQSVILRSEIFSRISLIENNNRRWLELFRLKSSSCSNPKSQWQVVKVVDTYGCVLRNVLSHSSDMGFDDMVAIQERHLTASLHPDLVFGVFCHQIQTRHTQSELTRLRELPNIDARTKQLLFGYICTQCNKLTVDVEDLIFDETEDGLLDGVLDEVLHRVTDVFVQLGKKHLGLLVCQWAHLNVDCYN